MATYQIVIGPVDASKLIERGKNAGGIHRIQIEFDIDTKSVIYYALDHNLNRMSDGNGLIMANGCPYPPNCGKISLTLTSKNISLSNENFAKCAALIKQQSDILGIDK